MACLALENVTLTFVGPQGQPVRALDRLNLEVADGERLVLVGPSGCGKTTTLRLIAGLESPDDGHLTLAGRRLNAVPPADREVAMVFQHQALFPHLTARENLTLGLRLRRLPAIEIEHRVAEAVEVLGLQDCLDRRPAALSGGECQRVALGRAWVRRPRLFLFDEPLSHLDAPLRAQLLDQILVLHERLGTPMIYVTHDQAEAMTLGQRIAVMRAGRIEQVGPPRHVYREPANLFVARFIGSPPINSCPATLQRTPGLPRFAILPDPAAAATAGQPVLLGVRPEAVRLGTLEPTSAGQVCLPAHVERLENLGAETLVHVRVHRQSWVVRVSQPPDLAPGQRVWLQIDPADVGCFDPVDGARLTDTSG